MHRPLLTALDLHRRHTARFRRVALHVHSPDSHDWARKGEIDRERNHRDRFTGKSGLDQYLGEIAPHLDLIAVTDHMRCTFAARLSAHSNSVIVLPGMEVNIRIEPLAFPRIHILTILPELSTPEKFARLLHGQPGIPASDDERTGNEEVTNLSLKEWVARCHDEGGLCIAAHVESNNGVRQSFRQAARDVLKLFTDKPSTDAEQDFDVPDVLKEYLFDSNLDAVEIRSSSDGQHFRWVSQHGGQIRSIATVLTFDAHNCEAFENRSRVTHVKMTVPGFGGLKAALRFPDTRIRFPQTLPVATGPRLLGLSIRGTDQSFFKDVTIALAENLNCIIGARGSGKSTIVEALRYVFGYNETLNELGRPMADSIREMQRTNLTDSVIRVVYQTRVGDIRVLQATYDDKADYATKCFSVDGDHIEVAHVEKCGDYPLRLFGWSELEILGRDMGRQRDLLDRLIPDLAPKIRQREAIRQRLKANRGELVQATSALRMTFESNGNHIVRFREFTADFNKLNTPDVSAQFAALDLARAKQRVHLQLSRNVEVTLSKVSALSEVSLRGEIDALLEKGTADLREWWLAGELQSLGVSAIEADVTAFAQQANARLSAFRALLTSRIEQDRLEIEQLELRLQQSFDKTGDDSMQRIADLRTNAERRLNEVAETRQKYISQWSMFSRLMAERASICSEMVDTQNALAGIRAIHNERIEALLNRFLPDWMEVSIEFVAGGDKAAFESMLTSAVPGRANNSTVARLRSAMLKLLNPVTCARHVVEESYHQFLGQARASLPDKEALTADEVEVWKDKSHLFEQNDDADVTVLVDDGARLNRLLDLQETPWDDHAAILLDGDPVNVKSPGQRASAMLPLIALAEEAPLIIDQPEDNLDKRLIGGVLMQVLAELKEKRQITVCTHDPNIVVGGDAEQVVVLNAESNRRGTVQAHGSIDNEGIVQTVIDLLEGGREAFEARRLRYSL